MEDKKTIWVGMDPGADGAIVLFDGENFELIFMPTKKVPTGKKNKNGTDVMKSVFDEEGMRDIVFDIHKRYPNCKFNVGVEKVIGRNNWSAQNNFNFGYNAGLLRMVAIMLGAEINEYRPAKWQNISWRGYDRVKVPSSTGKTMVNDAKATSEKVATSLYPNIDFRKTKRSKKNHDGAMDALLICVCNFRVNG